MLMKWVLEFVPGSKAFGSVKLTNHVLLELRQIIGRAIIVNGFMNKSKGCP
jgi:hypothetical protein